MFTVQVLTHDQVLTPLQQRNAFRQLGHAKMPAADTVICADDCLRLWVIMLLGRLAFLAPEQRTAIFEELTAGLQDHGHALEQAMRKTRAPAPLALVIADGQYVTWTGNTGWLDLVTGDIVLSPEQPPMETVAYNLAVLFGRNTLACRQLQRRLDDAASTEQLP